MQLFVLTLQQIKNLIVMPIAVRISDNLVKDAKIISKVEKRSVTGQIEHWAQIGKLAEKNPEMPYKLVKEILIGIEEIESGEVSEYQFG
jgi:hypothetical protein